MAKHNSKLGTATETAKDLESVKLNSLSRKEIGKAVEGSMPDDWDRKNIQAWVDLYEKAFPGQIAKLADDYKVELAFSGRSKDFSEISKDSELRLSMWLPAGFQEIMERAYPSFWTNRRHLAWFLENFPQFKGAPKH